MMWLQKTYANLEKICKYFFLFGLDLDERPESQVL